MDLEQIVVIDASNKKIKILDPVNTVEFDILNIENEILKGDIKKYPFNCVDDDGNKCIVEVILVKERFSTVRVKHDFVIMDLSAK